MLMLMLMLLLLLLLLCYVMLGRVMLSAHRLGVRHKAVRDEHISRVHFENFQHLFGFAQE
jgi:hypothetical protein